MDEKELSTETVQDSEAIQPTVQEPPLPPVNILYPILMVLCAFVFIQGVLLADIGISLFAFAVLFYGICLLYLRTRGVSPGRESHWFLAGGLLFALSCALLENSGIQELTLLCALTLMPMWLITAAGKRTHAELDEMLLPDFGRAAISLPLRYLGPSMRQMAGKGKNPKALLWTVVGLLIAIPLLLFVGNLLMMADGVFNNLVEDFAGRFLTDAPEILLRIVFSVLLGWYLFSMLYGVFASKREERKGFSLRVSLPVPLTSVILILLELLYLAFCAVQVSSLLQVSAGNQPVGFSYSEYARDGFFELCMVAVINLMVYLAVQIFSQERPRVTRVLLAGLGVLTLGLIATACVKMGLYMQEYGWTLLRVYTTWFMIMLAIVFCLLTAAQFVRLPLIRLLFIFCLAGFLALGLSNMPGLVTKVNASRYLSGSLESFDMEQYRRFPYEATPHLLSLYEQTEDEALWEEIAGFAERWQGRSGTPAYAKTVQRILAEKQLDAFVEGLE